jgi:hypothetical protein
MFLVTKSGSIPVCEYCHKEKSEGEWGHPKDKLNRLWLCSDCQREAIEEALRRFNDILSSGLPCEQMYTEFPVEFVYLASNDWWSRYRAAILARTPKHMIPEYPNFGKRRKATA